MPHAVVAVDQRGRRRGARYRDVRTLVEAASRQAAHILRQAENAVAVGAGEIGLAHQFGAARGVRLRQSRRGERVGDQCPGGTRRYAHDVARLHLISPLPAGAVFSK
jgi:hypothetical protein